MICYGLAGGLAVGFIIKTVRDWYIYTESFNSAPFRVFILVNGILLLVPAAILCLLGYYLKRKK